jgi:hypothetical protein
MGVSTMLPCLPHVKCASSQRLTVSGSYEATRVPVTATTTSTNLPEPRVHQVARRRPTRTGRPRHQILSQRRAARRRSYARSVAGSEARSASGRSNVPRVVSPPNRGIWYSGRSHCMRPVCSFFRALVVDCARRSRMSAGGWGHVHHTPQLRRSVNLCYVRREVRLGGAWYCR